MKPDRDALIASDLAVAELLWRADEGLQTRFAKSVPISFNYAFVAYAQAGQLQQDWYTKQDWGEQFLEWTKQFVGEIVG